MSLRSVALATALAVFASATAPAQSAPFTAIHAACMLDVRSGRMIPNGLVVVRRDTIIRVGGAATSIDLGDVTLLPCFIDMHTHLTDRSAPGSISFRYDGPPPTQHSTASSTRA
jgi:imidazolonepropionase-like amidohydrolase